MRFDPTIEVVCDYCSQSDYWTPTYVYTDLSGSFGYHDTSDAAFENWARVEDWIIDGDRTFCDLSCQEMHEEQNKPEA